MQAKITLEIVTPRSIIVRGKILNDSGFETIKKISNG